MKKLLHVMETENDIVFGTLFLSKGESPPDNVKVCGYNHYSESQPNYGYFKIFGYYYKKAES